MKKKLYIEEIAVAPYSIKGATVFGKQIEVRTFGKLLKSTLEIAHDIDNELFGRFINSGRLYVTRHNKIHHIVGNIHTKVDLRQPSKLSNVNFYIDTMISRQEALDALKRTLDYLGIEKQIIVETV